MSLAIAIAPSDARPVLVTGASGFLGLRTVARMEAAGVPVVAGLHRTPAAFGRARTRYADLGERKAVEGLIRDIRPSGIVHAAALTHTGACEQNPRAAARANVEATRHLLDAAATLAGDGPLPHFLFVSTDLVFDGEAAPYDESAPTHPVLEYGRSKERAEALVRDYDGPWTILRPALMYGASSPGRASFLDWMIAPLREGRELTLFTDEWRTPVWVEDVAEALVRLVGQPVGGVLHCGGGQRLSRFEMGAFVARRWGLPTSGLQGSRRAEANLACPRPRDVSMISARLIAALGLRPVGFEDGLHRIDIAAASRDGGFD